MARTNDEDIWCHFATAISVAKDTDHGIGFVLTSDLGIVGIDLDHCVEGKKIQPWARKIIDTLNTYTEVSPSGTGIRMFVYGDIPKALKRDQIELYKHVRFLTVTGNRLKGCSTIIEDRKGDIKYLYEAFKKPEVERTRRESRDFNSVTDDRLVEVIGNSKQGPKFRALMNGDASRYGSASEADMALCCILCWWTGDDRQIENVMRRSELVRDKWDRPDYIKRTIDSARQI
jgi:primase-polymerase (primpol)-like protein